MQRSKTIQLFLPNGNPRGIKVVHITSRIPVAIHFPRAEISEAFKREELRRSGVYFLFGDEEDRKTPVYVGESENCLQRLREHNRVEEFWQTAIAIVSRTGEPFTKCQIKFLEWLCCKEIQRIGRGKLVNSRQPMSEPFVSEPVKADLVELFETIVVLLSTIDYPIFAEFEQNGISLICKRRGANAIGELVDDGFLVKKGSTACLTPTQSCPLGIGQLRTHLVNSNVLKLQNGMFEFQEHYLFKSPSQAAGIVIGGSANGWTEWKDVNGITLNALLRKQAELPISMEVQNIIS